MKKFVLLAFLSLLPWRVFAQGGVAISINSGLTTPTTCRPQGPNVFINRSSSSVLKLCTSANAWTDLLPFTSSTITSLTAETVPDNADLLVLYDNSTTALRKMTRGNFLSGVAPPVSDTTSIVEGSSDGTKEIRFEVDGLTTGTIRVITPPDANTFLPVASQFLTFTGPTAARTITLPDANFTVARTDSGNQFTGNQGIGGAPNGTAGRLLDVIGNADQSTVIAASNSSAAGTSAAAGLRALASSAAAYMTAYGAANSASIFGLANLNNWAQFLCQSSGGCLYGNLSAAQVSIGANNVIAITIDSTGTNTTVSSILNSTGQRLAVAAKTGNYTMTLADQVLTGDTTSGSITFTLPAASSAFASGKGSWFRVKKLVAANSLIIARAGSDTVDGGASVTLTTVNSSVDIVAISTTAWGTF